ncbi:MAG: 3,4-dihydroxy-2-butanone-4-phosphate synthase [Deltaproteobacteria bacterium]|nr:3,4-dihydroxy-2-butanone-4-phosphate synthase [Deltaproteobacteria bacterium]
MPFENVEGAIEDIRNGKMIILVDDEDRENEGDLCMAAELVTPEAINFMAVHARGLICLTLTEDKIAQLDLPMMVERNTSAFGTGFTVSIEASEGVTTGISAHDRATTIRAAMRDDCRPRDLRTPGHVFPIRARKGGVLVRTGQTEGSVDLSRLAGLRPAGVICEIMNEDGTMARRPELEKYAAQHGLRIVTIAELIEYRIANEILVRLVAEKKLNVAHWGELTVRVMESEVDGLQHLVLQKGEIGPEDAPLVRVQSIDMPADLLGLVLSGGGAEMRAALDRMVQEGQGVFVYLVRSVDGSTLAKRLERVDQQNNTPPTYHRVGTRLDLREFGTGAQILKVLGIRKFRMMSNHEIRIVGLEGYGLHMTERVPLPVPAPVA